MFSNFKHTTLIIIWQHSSFKCWTNQQGLQFLEAYTEFSEYMEYIWFHGISSILHSLVGRVWDWKARCSSDKYLISSVVVARFYIAPLSQADSLHLQVILHKWTAFYSALLNVHHTVWQGIFLPQSIFGPESLAVFVPWLHTITCINSLVYIRNCTHWLPCHCLDTQVHIRNCTHWLPYHCLDTQIHTGTHLNQ